MMRNVPLLSVLAGACLWGCAGNDDDRAAPTTGADTTHPGGTGTGNTDDDGDADDGGDDDGGADGRDDDDHGDANEVCDAMCDMAATCLIDEPTEEDHADCVQVDCQGSFADFPSCRAEFEALFSCFAGLTCDEFALYMEGLPYPCQAEDDVAYDCADRYP